MESARGNVGHKKDLLAAAAAAAAAATSVFSFPPSHKVSRKKTFFYIPTYLHIVVTKVMYTFDIVTPPPCSCLRLRLFLLKQAVTKKSCDGACRRGKNIKVQDQLCQRCPQPMFLHSSSIALFFMCELMRDFLFCCAEIEGRGGRRSPNFSARQSITFLSRQKRKEEAL